jgi:hypothetical protein
MAVLSLPVELNIRAATPVAVLLAPVLLLAIAVAPVAVLPLPLLNSRTPSPIAVLSKPVVLERRASWPVAVLPTPVVLNLSADQPVAVFSPFTEMSLESAKDPTAVLPSEVRDSSKRFKSDRSVVVAGGVVGKRFRTESTIVGSCGVGCPGAASQKEILRAGERGRHYA